MLPASNVTFIALYETKTTQTEKYKFTTELCLAKSWN
ncbi:unnamed protein product [Blumeria hordei]|uniref:Uncharacterized protein n=1 Tax=Blumeria hordei TaxID=2867405 RepID=A0A383UWW1_BLUHO|nr:unnamed protein product [Blumeria hordei]